MNESKNHSGNSNGVLYQPKGVGGGEECVGREVQKGGHMCIPMDDSC